MFFLIFQGLFKTIDIVILLLQNLFLFFLIVSRPKWKNRNMCHQACRTHKSENGQYPTDCPHKQWARKATPGSERGFTVSVKYSMDTKSPPWTWKTVYEIIDEDHLIITAFNITPDGKEGKAVETKYSRVKP